jgi:hypothetical protein
MSGPRSRPTTQKICRGRESNPDLWICSQELWPLDHRGGDKILAFFRKVTDVNRKQFEKRMVNHKVTWRRSVCAPLVTLDSSNVRRICDSSTLATASEILSRSCREDCGVPGFRIYPSVKVAWSKIRRSRGPRIGCCSSYPSPLHLRRHFLWQWSKRYSRLIRHNQCRQQKLIEFPFFFQLLSYLYLQPFRKDVNFLPFKSFIIAQYH